MNEIDLRASWNRLSAHYQKQHNIRTEVAHYGVAAPDESRLNLLGDVDGKRILELGCGGGQCSLAFAKQGAACIGTDLSDEQIAHARALAETEGVSVEFHRADMADFLKAQPGSVFDIVFSAYAFQYVEDLATVFREAYRVLKPGGLFVFSLDHPLNDVTETADGKTAFCESYFARGRSDWDWGYKGEPETVPFYSFHRTVGDFLNLLVDAGFVVERLLEPERTAETDADPWANLSDFDRYEMIPATIIWKARRRASQ